MTVAAGKKDGGAMMEKGVCGEACEDSCKSSGCEEEIRSDGDACEDS